MTGSVGGMTGSDRAATAVPAGVAPGPPPAAGPSGAASGGGAVTVEALVELWPRVRLDVKAKNRRIEALLSSVDPVAVQGDLVTLAAAYDFHRNRLNSDEVRGLVADVISALVRQRVQITCVMRDDMVMPGPATAPSPAPARPPVAEARAVRETSTGTEYDLEPPTAPSNAPDADHPDAAAMAAPEVPWSEEAAMAEDDRRIAAIKNVFDAEEIPNGAR